MKKAEELKNYRLKYKRYYNIEFDSSYDVHHIDFDHTNNDINNLLLLPKKLHQRYHELIQALGFFKDMDRFMTTKFNVFYTADLLAEFAEVLKEIRCRIALQEEYKRRVQKWQ